MQRDKSHENRQPWRMISQSVLWLFLPGFRAGVPCSNIEGVFSSTGFEGEALGETQRGEHLLRFVCLPLWTGSKSRERLRVAQAIISTERSTFQKVYIAYQKKISSRYWCFYEE